MNWATLLKYLGPIISALLAALTSHNATGIQSGAFVADATNLSITGATGLGSLLSLIAGLIGSYKSTGKLPVFDVVEIAALESLGAALAKDGDTEGLALLSPLSRHVVTRKGAHFSLDQLLNPQQ